MGLDSRIEDGAGRENHLDGPIAPGLVLEQAHGQMEIFDKFNIYMNVEADFVELAKDTLVEVHDLEVDVLRQ